jgi:hypothetical protein
MTVLMTTYVVDKYGRVYDLAHTHPSREQAKIGNTTINIVRNAYTGPSVRAPEDPDDRMVTTSTEPTR